MIPAQRFMPWPGLLRLVSRPFLPTGLVWQCYFLVYSSKGGWEPAEAQLQLLSLVGFSLLHLLWQSTCGLAKVSSNQSSFVDLKGSYTHISCGLLSPPSGMAEHLGTDKGQLYLVNFCDPQRGWAPLPCPCLPWLERSGSGRTAAPSPACLHGLAP